MKHRLWTGLLAGLVLTSCSSNDDGENSAVEQGSGGAAGVAGQGGTAGAGGAGGAGGSNTKGGAGGHTGGTGPEPASCADVDQSWDLSGEDIAVADGEWLAVATARPPSGVGAPNCGLVFHSVDGEAWTWQQQFVGLIPLLPEGTPIPPGEMVPEASVQLERVLHANGTWLIAAREATVSPRGFLISTTDLASWTVTTHESAARSLAAANGLFLWANRSGVFRSSDGLSWETVFDEPNFREVGAAGGLFFLQSGAELLVSEDGSSWSDAQTSGDDIPNYGFIHFSATRDEFLGYASYPLGNCDEGCEWEYRRLSSPDGETWGLSSTIEGLDVVTEVAETSAGCHAPGANHMAFANDCLHYVENTSSPWAANVAASADRLVALSASEKPLRALTSTDHGETWQETNLQALLPTP